MTVVPSSASLDAAPVTAQQASAWPAGGRFVDAGFADLSTLDNFVYADHIPPELAPSVFFFQKVAAGGFQAELDFPAPVTQLQYYLNQDSGDEGDPGINGSVPVSYTVDLLLHPPAGDPTTVSLQTDGTTVVTRSGVQIASAKSVFAGTRLIMAVPPSVGVQDTWTVQAVIQLSGAQPLNAGGGGVQLPATLSVATTPALVGVLTGDNARAPEPFAVQSLYHSAQVAVQSPNTQPLPKGGQPTSIHLVRGSRGLFAEVTLDSPPRLATTTVGGQPVSQEDLQLVLAPGVQDGLGIGRVTIDWPYPACRTCPMSQSASVTLLGQYIGYIPVTVAGHTVNFDFGDFRSYTSPTQPAQSGNNATGFSTQTFTFTSQDLNIAPIGNAPVLAPEDTTWTVNGTAISIKRASESTPATGWVDLSTAYFFAYNQQEMWSGFLGTEGWYSRLSSAQTTAVTLPGDGDPTASFPRTRAQLTDLYTPQHLQRLADYVWQQKIRKAWQAQLNSPLGEILQFWKYGGGPRDLQIGPTPPGFVQALKRFLQNGGLYNGNPEDKIPGQIDQDVLDKAFPNGYDPIVVAPPRAIPFPLASALPAMAPKGAQWEIAVGMKVLDRTSLGLRWQSPFVPASSLLSK